MKASWRKSQCSFPDKSGSRNSFIRSRNTKEWSACWAWANPNHEPGIGCMRQPAPHPNALHAPLCTNTLALRKSNNMLTTLLSSRTTERSKMAGKEMPSIPVLTIFLSNFLFLFQPWRTINYTRRKQKHFIFKNMKAMPSKKAFSG